METKICIKCGKELPLDRFKHQQYKTVYGEIKLSIHNICRLCAYERDKKNVNKEKHALHSREYWAKKTPEDKIIHNQKRRKYYYENKERLRKITNETNKKRRKENPELVHEQDRKTREKKKQKQGRMFDFKSALRTRVNYFLKQKNYSKTKSTEKIIGCDYIFLRNWIELRFEKGMTWDNFGEWHIDHIIPLSSAKTEDDVLLLFHYKNLRPIWASDNLKKGAKIIEGLNQLYLPI